MSEPDTTWTVVLPLKGGDNAKSRLGAPPELATAIALDCLGAVLAARDVAQVVVVTPDPRLAGLATAAGASVRAEAQPGSGLLAAIGDGLAGLRGPCAVLLADLPALRPDDLSTALRLAHGLLTRDSSGPDMVFAPDADGVGTVLLAALEPVRMHPAFGPASAGAHRAAGALQLDVELPRLRRDVDTREDLRAAMALGVGPHTRAALARLPSGWVATLQQGGAQRRPALS